MTKSINILLLVLTAISTQKSFARPEYAALTHIVNCAVCHVNPYGSGARTVYGKLYGSRDFRPNWASKQEIVSLDVRGQDYYYQPVSPTNTQSKGVMIMNVIPTVNLPLAPSLDEPALGNLVLSYNFAAVGQGLREAYYLNRFAPTSETAWISAMLVGNFMAPFGLLTDEHRTYTHQMVAMTNREFESGLLVTGDPTYKMHYDLAISSGFANGGLGTDSHPDSWGVFANFRHQIRNLPLQVGLSYAIEGTSAANYPLTAGSLYGVFAWDQYAPKFKGNIQTEIVAARGWNNSSYTTAAGDGIGNFVPSTATNWLGAIQDSTALGFASLANWDLTPHWTIQLKYEQFIPEMNYQGDSFYRTGGGFKYAVNANVNLLARYDHGYVNRPGLSSTDLTSIKAIGDTYFALLHIWL